MGMRKAANASSHPAAPVGTPAADVEHVEAPPVEVRPEVIPDPPAQTVLSTPPAPEAAATAPDASVTATQPMPTEAVAPEAASDGGVEATVRGLRPVVNRPVAGEDDTTFAVQRVQATAPASAKSLMSVPSLSSAPVSMAAPSVVGLDLQPPSGVRDIAVSKRGKRDYNYSWPKDDVAQMQAAWEHYRPLYRRYWQAQNPRGAYKLARSPFFAQALLEAFRNPSAWLETVRNDARKEPLIGGREQVGLVWPVEVEEQVVDLFETLDRSQFPAGFSLTKQHLAAAAILHGLASAERWYLTVPNDDRHSIPVETDGRLKDNKVSATPVTSPA